MLIIIQFDKVLNWELIITYLKIHEKLNDYAYAVRKTKSFSFVKILMR